MDFAIDHRAIGLAPYLGGKLSHQYLTNVQCWNRRNHSQTKHPKEIFISMNLLQMPCVIT